MEATTKSDTTTWSWYIQLTDDYFVGPFRSPRDARKWSNAPIEKHKLVKIER